MSPKTVDNTEHRLRNFIFDNVFLCHKLQQARLHAEIMLSLFNCIFCMYGFFGGKGVESKMRMSYKLPVSKAHLCMITRLPDICS